MSDRTSRRPRRSVLCSRGVSTTPQQIDLWRQVPSEHQRLEFKEAKNQFDQDKLRRYCVALANEGGGHLVLGVADRPPRAVVGTAAFPNPVAQAQDLFNQLGFRVDVEEVAHPDGRIIVFHIPSRPRGSAYALNGAYWMRAGEGLTPMSEDRLRTIFKEGQPDWAEEYAAVTLDAAQIVALLDTQAFFALLKLPYPASRDGVIDRLVSERLIDQTGHAYAIRRLGALLLARSLADFPDLARKAPRTVVYSGTSKLDTQLDHTATSGYAVGFQRLVQFIMSHLPRNEIIEHALRKEVTLVPEVVIRELTANALIHQDLTVGGASVMIEIYRNRVEISNPGEPIVPVERFIDGYQSRNERLADLMRRMGVCEEKSSGIDRVVQAAEMFQLPAPEFRIDFRRTMATIYGPKNFEDMDRDDRTRACYQHCVLKWVMAEHMTNQSLRERFRLPENRSTTASQIIAATVEAGLIKSDARTGASKKFARYLPFWAS